MAKDSLNPLFVVGQHDSEVKDRHEVGLSLNGYNPADDDFFEMPIETAIRLKERLSAITPPISFYPPIGRPANK